MAGEEIEILWVRVETDCIERNGKYLSRVLLMASEDEADWNWVELQLSKLILVRGAPLEVEFMPAAFTDAVPHPYVD